MSSIAITCNGPGEWSGWARPLLRELYRHEPGLDAHVFFVPDDYATGREPEVARATFPQLHVHPPREYIAVALGRTVGGVPQRVDRVQYLGGDLMHAARLNARLGGTLTSYKFSRPRYRNRVARVFAVDERNREQLEAWKTPPERISVVGNLAIDGALGEAAGAYGNDAAESGLNLRDGIFMLPGSRRMEIAGMLPFLVSVAVWVRRKDASIPVAFGISPFATDADVDAALRRGGPPRAYGTRAGLERQDDGTMAIVTLDEGLVFPVVHGAMRAAAGAGLAVTIPGTKTMELAALGVPTLVCTPFNVPEDVVINGPLQYIDRLPYVGTPLKRAAVVAVARRFSMYSQVNMDAGRMVQPELRGTLFPARVATVALGLVRDRPWREEASAASRALYAPHAGAAARFAGALLGAA